MNFKFRLMSIFIKCQKILCGEILKRFNIWIIQQKGQFVKKKELEADKGKIFIQQGLLRDLDEIL